MRCVSGGQHRGWFEGARGLRRAGGCCALGEPAAARGACVGRVGGGVEIEENWDKVKSVTLATGQAATSERMRAGACMLVSGGWRGGWFEGARGRGATAAAVCWA